MAHERTKNIAFRYKTLQKLIIPIRMIPQWVWLKIALPSVETSCRERGHLPGLTKPSLVPGPRSDPPLILINQTQSVQLF